MSNFNSIVHRFLIIVLISSSTCRYDFSVIIAIYNTGRYLDDSIGSLINQTFGFEKIQIILINDGSFDDTKEICLRYQREYPDNIIYKKIEHGGVSKARNIGLKYAKGKYINFLDPDDIWDSKVFGMVFTFYRLYPKVDLVAGRMKFFEAKNNYHLLDYKFSKTRVVNLLKDYSNIQLSASSCFFRASKIKNKKFNENIIVGEDTLFVNIILLKNPILGLIREAIYYYRSRSDGTSAIQTLKREESFYFDTPLHVHYYLIKLSILLYNEIVPFIQYYLAYDILLRIRAHPHKYLNRLKYIKYREIIENLLKYISDIYILKQRIVTNTIKLLALSKKHGKDLRNDLVFTNGALKYSGRIMINSKYDTNIIFWKILEIKNDILYLEGKDNFWAQRKNFFHYCMLGNDTYFPQYKEYIHYDLNSLYGVVIKGRTIKFEIPLYKIKEQNQSQVLYMFISYLGNKFEIFPTLDLFSHIPPIPNGYYISDNYIIRIEEKRLDIYPNSKELKSSFEHKYCAQLKLINKEYLIKLRKNTIKYNNIKYDKREIWLINDRNNKAGDNGEYFFKYLNDKHRDEIDSYFIISDNCEDYHRLKKIGNVIPLGSDEHKKKFLIADKIISSMCNNWVDNPFGEDRRYIYDLFHYDYIFLQHGISKDDVSNFFHRLNKNFTMIITASKKEYQSFLSPIYNYNISNIKLTGFSRYDNLEHLKNTENPEKIILLIPTWRIYIKGTIDPLTSKSIYSNLFKKTKYFEYYDNLINDPILLQIMEKYKYKGYFCLHPSFTEQWIDFRKNSRFKIKDYFNYQKLLSKASLLITDYSSIFFDFAYMEKPIIYTQFDYEEYRNSHYKQGYFDYEKDGFGPIYYNLEETIIGIIKEIENNCVLKKKYLRRIRNFFAFFDENNNERIFKAIYSLSHKPKKIFLDKILSFCKSVYVFVLFFIFCKKINSI